MLRDDIARFTDLSGEDGEHTSIQRIGSYLDGYDSAMQWIPVGERLPKEYAQYLVCFKTGECYVYWLEDSDWSRSIIELEEIVAWMPLPEPYKGVEEK